MKYRILKEEMKIESLHTYKNEKYEHMISFIVVSAVFVLQQENASKKWKKQCRIIFQNRRMFKWKKKQRKILRKKMMN